MFARLSSRAPRTSPVARAYLRGHATATTFGATGTTHDACCSSPDTLLPVPFLPHSDGLLVRTGALR